MASRSKVEWAKRISVLIVTALWAILIRELIPVFQLSKWTVTGASSFVFIFSFWLADITGKPWTK